MVEINRDHDAVSDNDSGKQLHHIARYADPRPVGPDKSVIDVVTDDLAIYRFTRFEEGTPWKFEPGTAQPGDRRMRRTGRLPSTVEAIMEEEARDARTDFDSGVKY